MAKVNKCDCGKTKYYKARYCNQCKKDKALAFCPYCDEPILKADRFGTPYPTCYHCREIPADEQKAMESVLDNEYPRLTAQQAQNDIFVEPSMLDDGIRESLLSAVAEAPAQKQARMVHRDYPEPKGAPTGTCGYCRRDLYASDLANMCQYCVLGFPDND